MMNRPRLFLQRADPRLEHFEDKEVVAGDQLPVDDLAFEVGVALVDKRRLDARGGFLREAEGLELGGTSRGTLFNCSLTSVSSRLNQQIKNVPFASPYAGLWRNPLANGDPNENLHETHKHY